MNFECFLKAQGPLSPKTKAIIVEELEIFNQQLAMYRNMPADEMNCLIQERIDLLTLVISKFTRAIAHGEGYDMARSRK